MAIFKQIITIFFVTVCFIVLHGGYLLVELQDKGYNKIQCNLVITNWQNVFVITGVWYNQETNSLK
jgi:hypothetical protein